MSATKFHTHTEQQAMSPIYVYKCLVLYFSNNTVSNESRIVSVFIEKSKLDDTTQQLPAQSRQRWRRLWKQHDCKQMPLAQQRGIKQPLPAERKRWSTRLAALAALWPSQQRCGYIGAGSCKYVRLQQRICSSAAHSWREPKVAWRCDQRRAVGKLPDDSTSTYANLFPLHTGLNIPTILNHYNFEQNRRAETCTSHKTTKPYKSYTK